MYDTTGRVIAIFEAGYWLITEYEISFKKGTEIITVNISNIANASVLAGLGISPTGGGIAIAAGQGYLYAKKVDSNGEYREKKPNSNIKGQKATQF